MLSFKDYQVVEWRITGRHALRESLWFTSMTPNYSSKSPSRMGKAISHYFLPVSLLECEFSTIIIMLPESVTISVDSMTAESYVRQY